MKKSRVGFVDDDKNLISSLKRSLVKYSDEWDVFFYTNPFDLVEAFKKEPIDVVVSDLKMPKLCGLELRESLRGLDQDLQFIILSGAAGLADVAKAINESSVLRFFVKPINAAQLMEGVSFAIAERKRQVEARERRICQADALPSVGRAALARLPVGVIVINLFLRVVFMNPRGVQIINDNDGLMVDQGGAIRATNSNVSFELHSKVKNAFARAPNGGLSSIVLHRPSMAHPYVINIEPVKEMHRLDDEQDLAVLYVTDPENPPTISTSILMQMFNLSLSEARVAAGLAEGSKLSEIAERLQLTPSTVRTYLKHVYAKTNTQRQAELVKVILLSSMGSGLEAS